MRLSISIVLSALSLQSSCVLSVLATPGPINGSADVQLRDPTIWYNTDAKKYYVFSTGGNISTFTSPALIGPWDEVGAALPNCTTINMGGDKCTLWAPDVNYQNGRYVMYFASPGDGRRNASIGMATSPSMDPGTWVDHGEVVRSEPKDTFDAIDANLIHADGLKLAFGSYNDGMFLTDLTNITTPSSSLPGSHLAGSGDRPAEGGFMYTPSSSDYCYFFFSYGHTPLVGESPRPPAGQEYRVLVGRSKSVSGTFVDKNGDNLTKNVKPPTGTVVLATHDNVYAPGGQSIFLDPVSKRDVIVYHYVRENAPAGGPSYLGINYLDFSSGWPVVVN